MAGVMGEGEGEMDPFPHRLDKRGAKRERERASFGRLGVTFH